MKKLFGIMLALVMMASCTPAPKAVEIVEEDSVVVTVDSPSDTLIVDSVMAE